MSNASEDGACRESPQDAVAAIVRWLRSLKEPQDPQLLADEIEQTSLSSRGGPDGK